MNSTCQTKWRLLVPLATNPEFFDFIEDHVEENRANHVYCSCRRDCFISQQESRPSSHEITTDDLPPRDAEIEGIRWLPRIICKARAKLRELHPNIMYACGGDRNFLKQDIHPATLRFIWGAGE